nr:unnamed protein product [Digitaria exilis]
MAVRRSRGQCRAFLGECAGNKDGFLLHLAHQAPLLRSLTLISCNVISRRGFMDAIKMFPLLEELHISDCWKPEFFDMEAMEIAKMHELRSLQLFHNQLTNIGLSAILDGCPHLESLDVRGCYCVDLHDEAMRAKCARIKTKKIFTPNPEDECEDFEPANYYDPCYGLDSLDEIGLEVHDRMLCKRARR